MTSPVQAAAARWEEDAARYLRDHGFPAERQRVKHPDRGDVGGVPDWTLECKGLDKMARRKAGPSFDAYIQARKNVISDGWELEDYFMAGFEAGRLSEPRFDMARAMDQAMRARAVNGHPYAAVIRKRSGMPAARAYVIVELGVMAPIMQRLEEA